MSRCLEAFAPGRCELAGNHTDHEGGLVIAGTVGEGISAVAAPRPDPLVCVESAGFAPCQVDLSEGGWRDPRPEERVSSQALLRGMLAQLDRAGVPLGGFDARLTTTLPAGGGLSSSAAFELLIGVIARDLFADGTDAAREVGGQPGEDPAQALDAPLGPVALARMGQAAECDYFGKPCGLMDQLAVACGGILEIDFEDPGHPRVSPIDIDFAARGWAVCLVDTGCDHSRFTEEYAAVPREMQAVARLCGAERLGQVPRSLVLERMGDIRSELGDRAFLRAMHFYHEEALTIERSEALRAGDIPRFLTFTRESGASSAMFLQNVSAGGTYQPAMVALALVQSLVNEEALVHGYRRGACRIHGGGFGGTIEAFVGLDGLDDFVRGIEKQLGPATCQVLTIGGKGAHAAWA